MVGHTFFIREALRDGWNLTKKHFWFFWLMMLVLIGVSLFPDSTREWTQEPSVLFFTLLATVIFTTVVEVGIITLILKFHDSKGGRFAEIFTGYPLALKYFGASMSYSIVSFAPLLLASFLLILSIAGDYGWFPGLPTGPIWPLLGESLRSFTLLLGILATGSLVWAMYAGVKYQFAGYMVVDRGTGVLESLRESGRVTRGRENQLITFWCVLIALNVLGAAIVLIGLLFTVPVSVFAFAYVYRQLVGAPFERPKKLPADKGFVQKAEAEAGDQSNAFADQFVTEVVSEEIGQAPNRDSALDPSSPFFSKDRR